MRTGCEDSRNIRGCSHKVLDLLTRISDVEGKWNYQISTWILASDIVRVTSRNSSHAERGGTSTAKVHGKRSVGFNISRIITGLPLTVPMVLTPLPKTLPHTYLQPITTTMTKPPSATNTAATAAATHTALAGGDTSVDVSLRDVARGNFCSIWVSADQKEKWDFKYGQRAVELACVCACVRVCICCVRVYVCVCAWGR
jgi:hypothetical protein